MKKLVVVCLVVLVAGVGAGYAVGLGPAPGGETGTDIESFPTETPTSSAEDTNTTTAGPPFSVRVDSIESCGDTCRDVTTTLTNRRSDAASNVTVYTRIYAGNGTDGEVLWEGVESVGDLEGGESHTATRRVELSLAAGYTVREADGWITVRTTVTSDEETITVTEQRQLTSATHE